MTTKIRFQGAPEQCPQCGALVVDSVPGPDPLTEFLKLACGARWVYEQRTDTSYPAEPCEDADDTGACPT